MSTKADIKAAHGLDVRRSFCFRRRVLVPVFVVLLVCSLCLQSFRQASHTSHSAGQEKRGIFGNEVDPFDSKNVGHEHIEHRAGWRGVLHAQAQADPDHRTRRRDTSDTKRTAKPEAEVYTQLVEKRVSRQISDIHALRHLKRDQPRVSRKYSDAVALLSQSSHRRSLVPSDDDPDDLLPLSVHHPARGRKRVRENSSFSKHQADTFALHEDQPLRLTSAPRLRKTASGGRGARSDPRTAYNHDYEEEDDVATESKLGGRESMRIRQGSDHVTAGTNALSRGRHGRDPEVGGRHGGGSGIKGRDFVRSVQQRGLQNDYTNAHGPDEDEEDEGGEVGVGRRSGRVGRHLPRGEKGVSGTATEVPGGDEDDVADGNSVQVSEESEEEWEGEDMYDGREGTGGERSLDDENELERMRRLGERGDLEPYYAKGRWTGGGLRLHESQGDRRSWGRSDSLSWEVGGGRLQKLILALKSEEFRTLPESLGRLCECFRNGSVRATPPDVTAGCVQTRVGSSLYAAEQTYQSHLEHRWQQFPGTFRPPHFPSYAVLQESYMDYFATVLHPCPGEERLGSWGEGGKWVCRPEQLPSSAVVYSIGSNAEASFERDVHELTGSVPHAFDHSISPHLLPAMRSLDFLRFHAVGLDGTNDKKRRLVSIDHVMRRLGHAYVDVLKIDCEGCEVRVFDAVWAKAGFYRAGDKVLFGQVLVEYHHVDEPNVMIRSFAIMEGLGYRMFHVEPNYQCAKCIEVAYIHESLVKPC